MGSYWHKKEDGVNYYIDLDRNGYPGKVFMSHDRGHWKSEEGGYVTYLEFLNGQFQDIVVENFDEQVLAEVIAAVRKRLELD